MYFITEKDPDYNIKGSRDPLGFQVIWQAAGRKLIPNLSTVSNNLIDFQILGLAYTIKKEFKIADANFESFFIRFEQIMAYTRHYKDKSEGFNGVDKVRKTIASNEELKISVNNQILSNQKAYGIWGKYNRPFSEMKFDLSNDFHKLFSDKLKSNLSLRKQVQTIINSDSKLKYDVLEKYMSVIEKPNEEEKKLFIERILQDNCNQELLSILHNNQGWIGLNFYDLLNFLISKSSNPNFISILEYIVQVEKTICPLNRIFRYLQTKSFWTNEEIEKSEFISKCKMKGLITEGFDETLNALAILHNNNSNDLVKGLIERNKTICKLRNSSPWMEITENGYEINHFEGASFYNDYNPERNNDNNYFFWSYLNLFNQLN